MVTEAFLDIAARVLIPIQISGRMACHPAVTRTLLNPNSRVVAALRREAMQFFNVQPTQAQLRAVINCTGNSTYFNYRDPINSATLPVTSRRLSDAYQEQYMAHFNADVAVIEANMARWHAPHDAQYSGQLGEPLHLRFGGANSIVSGGATGGWARRAAATVCPNNSTNTTETSYAGSIQAILSVHVTTDAVASGITYFLRTQLGPANATLLNGTIPTPGQAAVYNGSSAFAFVNSTWVNPCLFNASMLLSGLNSSVNATLPSLSVYDILAAPFGSTFLTYLRTRLYQADTSGLLAMGVMATIPLNEVTTTPAIIITKLSAMEKVLMYLGIGAGILAIMACFLIVVVQMRCYAYCKPNKRIDAKQIRAERAVNEARMAMLIATHKDAEIRGALATRDRASTAHQRALAAIDTKAAEPEEPIEVKPDVDEAMLTSAYKGPSPLKPTAGVQQVLQSRRKITTEHVATAPANAHGSQTFRGLGVSTRTLGAKRKSVKSLNLEKGKQGEGAAGAE